MKFSKFILISTFLLAACSFKGTQPSERKLSTNDSAFVFLPATLLSVETSNVDQIFGLPNQKTYHFQACVLDRATQQRAVGVSFSVEAPQSSPVAKTTDAAGCLQWSEKISFRPFPQREAYISVPKLLSVDGYRIELPLAVNPWIDGSQGFVDLRTVEKQILPVAPEASEHALYSNSEGQNTFVERLTLSLVEQNGAELTYTFSGIIKARRLTEEGSVQDISLPSGKFKTKLFVIEAPQGGEPRVLAKSAAFSSEVQQSLFTATAKLQFLQDPDGQSPTFLYYEMEPTSPEAGVTPTSGSRSFSTLRDGTNGTPDVSDALTDAAEAAIKSLPRETPNPPQVFLIDGTHGEFSNSLHYDASSSRRTIQFTAQARLVDPLSPTKPLAFHPFEYLVSDTEDWPTGKAAQNAQSDSRGEIRVNGELDYFELSKSAQKYFKKYLLVRSSHPAFRGVTRSAAFWINPWQRDSLFYRDEKRQGTPTQISELTTPPAQLVLSDYSADFLGRTFEVDRYLHLTTLRRWSLTLKPMVSRTSVEGGTKSFELSEGTRLKLSVVLADPSVDATKDPIQGFISGYESEVAVNSSQQISTEVVFPVDFTDQPRLDSRGRIYITLTPVTTDGGLVEPIVLGANFVSNPNGNDNSNAKAISFDPALRGTLPRIPKEKTRAITTRLGTGHLLSPPDTKSVSPLELYTKYWRGHGPIETFFEGTDLRAHFTGTQAGALKSAAFSDKPPSTDQLHEILSSFCLPRSGFLSEPDRVLCKQHPEYFFHFSQVTLVENLVQPNTELAVSSTSTAYTTVAASFFKEHQYSSRLVSADKASEHFIAGVSSKNGYGLLGNEATAGTAFNQEKEWYDLVEFASGDSERSRYSAAETVTLSKEQITIPLDAEVRFCSLVRPQPFVLEIAKSAKSPLKSYLFCSTTQVRKGIQESWYSIRDRWNPTHSALTDPKSPFERGWYKMIRGPQALEAFEKIVRNELREFYFKKVDPFIDGVDSFLSPAFTPAQKARLFRDGGIFPGVLSLSDPAPLRWSELQVNRYAKKLALGATSNGVAPPLAQDFASCFYENASRRWDHADYVKNATEFNEQLRVEGVRDLCVHYANRNGAKP